MKRAIEAITLGEVCKLTVKEHNNTLKVLYSINNFAIK